MAHHSMPAPGEKKSIMVDANEFIRTRDALSTAFVSLSGAIDKAVRTYIEHTNVVLAGDETLNVSHLLQPFNSLTAYAQTALQHAGVAGHTLAIEENGDSKKSKRKYTPRDPNAPKRPLTAYFRYLQEVRGPLAKEAAQDPNASHKPGDISKTATARWKAMPDDEQQPYRDAYQHALKDYERELAAYKASGGVVPSESDDVIDPQLEAADVKEVKAGAQDDDTSDDDTSTDEDEDDKEDADAEEEEMPPPPPPKSKAKKQSESPEAVKKTPKSAMKKNKQADPVPTPQFSSINPEGIPPSSAAKDASPELKRKASADTEKPAKKRRGPKTKVEKEAIEAAATAAAAAAPSSSAVIPSTPAQTEDGAKAKKERKKRRKSEA